MTSTNKHFLHTEQLLHFSIMVTYLGGGAASVPLGDCVVHVCDQMEISETSSGVKLVPTSAVAYDPDLFLNS